MMFFVRMIRLIPMVVILLVIGLIIYIVAQIKYSPNKAKAIVLKVFFWICIVLTAFFLLCCLYCILDGNVPALELFASFAAVPAFGLLIVLLCKAIFHKNHPNYKYEAAHTSANESFVEFWKKRIIKFIASIINKNIPKP